MHYQSIVVTKGDPCGRKQLKRRRGACVSPLLGTTRAHGNSCGLGNLYSVYSSRPTSSITQDENNLQEWKRRRQVGECHKGREVWQRKGLKKLPRITLFRIPHERDFLGLLIIINKQTKVTFGPKMNISLETNT